ncbi:MAG: cytochrome c [Myxococcales bacterium]|nr:cytochrome c [Myxococcales bacterium]
MSLRALRPGLVGLAATGLLGALAGACGGKRGFTEPMVLGGETVAPETLNRGQGVYDRFCATCHGFDGKADTPGGRRLDPRPRDFTTADFKYGDNGALPTNAQLEKTIRHGIPGSGMPAWPNLSEQELEGVVQYIKTFSPRWQAGHDGADARRRTVLPVAGRAASFRPRQPGPSGLVAASRGVASALADSPPPIALGER